MAKNVIGIDISDFSIEAVVLDKKKGHFVVDKYSRFRLSPDIVDDGKILNSEKLKDALQRLFKNAQPKPIEGTKKVFLSIPESKVFTRILTLPKNLKEKEIYEAAKHKAEEVVPEAQENLIPAMKMLPVKGDIREIFYTEAEVEIVNDFVKVFEELGIDIEGITTESISSFVGLHDDLKKENTLMLDIGARTTIASIFDANGIRSSVNINIAGNNLTSALVKKMSISHAAAEDAKHKYGMTAAEDGGVMMVIQGQLQPLVDELNKFINYYQENSGQKIEHLVLIGGLAQMKGIDRYFGDNLNMQAYVGQAFIDNQHLPANMNSSKYINALGLARLSYEKVEINFYDSLLKQDKREKKQEDKDKPKHKGDKKKIKDSDAAPFYKNKLFMVFLVVLILVGGVFVYKFIIQKDAPVDIPATQEMVEQKTNESTVKSPSNLDIKAGLELSKNILVSDVPRPGQLNFILGEIFELREEVNFQSTSDLDYAAAWQAMLDEISTDVISKTNTEHTKDGYYIVPVVIKQIEETSLPGEDEYAPGVILSATIVTELLAMSENAVKTALFDGLSTEQLVQIQDNYKHVLSYKVINEEIGIDDAVINLSVTLVLEEK